MLKGSAQASREYIDQLERRAKQLDGACNQLKQECIVLAALLCKERGGEARVSLADVQLLSQDNVSVDLELEGDTRVYSLAKKSEETKQ